MKQKSRRGIFSIAAAMLLVLPAVAQAQLNYFNNGNGTCTITGYTTAPIGALNITNTINGLKVTGISYAAFDGCTALSSLTIPNSMTNIASYAFYGCYSLTNVEIGTNVTIIGDYAFSGCSSLSYVYFPGNAPVNYGNEFYGDLLTVYYLPGTTGWGATFGGRPAVLWNPQAVCDGSFGVHANGFGFTISGTPGIGVVVGSCTNLVHPVWRPVSTLTLTNGTAHFNDPNRTNNPACFYRLQTP